MFVGARKSPTVAVVEYASVILGVPRAEDLKLTGDSGFDLVIGRHITTHFPAQDRPIAIIRHLQSQVTVGLWARFGTQKRSRWAAESPRTIQSELPKPKCDFDA